MHQKDGLPRVATERIPPGRGRAGLGGPVGLAALRGQGTRGRPRRFADGRIAICAECMVRVPPHGHVRGGGGGRRGRPHEHAAIVHWTRLVWQAGCPKDHGAGGRRDHTRDGRTTNRAGPGGRPRARTYRPRPRRPRRPSTRYSRRLPDPRWRPACPRTVSRTFGPPHVGWLR